MTGVGVQRTETSVVHLPPTPASSLPAANYNYNYNKKGNTDMNKKEITEKRDNLMSRTDAAGMPH